MSSLFDNFVTNTKLKIKSLLKSDGAVGSIDSCTDEVVSGWIKLNKSDDYLLVDIYIDGYCIASGVRANEFRPDVALAGYGSGAYGFSCTYRGAEMFTEADTRTVDVRLSGASQSLLKKKFESVTLNTEDKTNYKIVIDGIHNENNKHNVVGWGLDRLNPGNIFQIDVLIDGAFITKIQNDRCRNDLVDLGILPSGGMGGVSYTIPGELLPYGTYCLTLRAPDGSSASIDIKGHARRRPFTARLPYQQSPGVAVIVPVFNAVEDLKVCIDRLRAHTPEDVDIILLDDASTDPEIKSVLSGVEHLANFRVLYNEKNLGFSGTINRGIEEAGSRDVILLNSDARVTRQWSEGLRLAVYSAPNIATATPLSDRAGAFSAPEIGNNNILPAGIDEIGFARSVRRLSAGLYPEVPTGNGFCMYIRRECIDQVGRFDAAAFPRGYGEENDFCMRALRAGWRHVVDDRTYVFHDRSKSFGSSKEELMAAGRRIVDERYPEYKAAISVFTQGESMMMMRHRARLAALPQNVMNAKRKRLLFVISTTTGGTPQTNRDLMNALDGDFEKWVLRCNRSKLYLYKIVDNDETLINEHDLGEAVSPLTHVSGEYDSVVYAWLMAYDFDLLHIRHLAWHSLNLPELAHRLRIPVVFSFHDFYMVSPTIKLVDDTGKYLGDTFLPEAAPRRQSVWPAGSQPEPIGKWIDLWRERSGKALSYCAAFITTSDSARALILRRFPEIPADRFKVIAHGRDFPAFHRLREPYLRHNQPVRILVPGNIDYTKGLDVFMKLAELDTAHMLEFHILGNAARKDRQFSRHFHFHGTYNRNDFASKVAKIRPHMAAVFSIWDETWCHTLTEAWAAGLPVAVLDMPTVAGRVKQSRAGWVLDHNDMPKLYQQILHLATSTKEQVRTDKAVAEWQAGEGLANTTRVMAARYLDVYRALLSTGQDGNIKPAPRVAVVCPANYDLRRAPASTFVRVWERTLNSVDRDVTYIRMTPESSLAAAENNVIDAAIIQRTALPATLVSRVIDTLKAKGIPYIFEIDDNLLDVSSDKDGTGLYSRYAPHIRRLIKEAATVTVSTEALAREVSKYTSRTEVIPNRLSDRLWRRPLSPRIQNGTVQALYMGTPTHEDDLNLVLPALDKVAAETPAFRLTLIGISDDSKLLIGREHWLKKIEVPQVNKDYNLFVPWLFDQIKQIDFAIAPLTDAPFNLRKSPLKVLDYAALGLPVIVSDHSVYRSLSPLPPDAVVSANTVEAWYDALKNMIALGERGRDITLRQADWALTHAMLSSTGNSFDPVVKKITNYQS